MPNLVNFDGDKLIFSETRFPIQDPTRSGEIQSCLHGLPDPVPDQADQPTWTWPTGASPGGTVPGTSSGAATIKTDDEHGGRFLGSVRLDPAAVALQTNSVERAERGLVGRGARLPGESAADRDADTRAGDGGARGDGRRCPPPERPLPPEEMAALLHEVEDRHYREILSQPIPMLDGKSRTGRAVQGGAPQGGRVAEVPGERRRAPQPGPGDPPTISAGCGKRSRSPTCATDEGRCPVHERFVKPGRG